MAYLSKRTGEEVDALLDKVEQGGGGVSIIIDTELSETSDNAIANSAVAKALKDKQNLLSLTTKPNGNIVIGNLAGQTKEFMPATPSGDPMHYAYEAVGATWNASTGYWELNELTNITNTQMRAMYAERYISTGNNLWDSYYRGSINSTNISACIWNSTASTQNALLGCSNMITIALGGKKEIALPNNIQNTFRNCRKLRKVVNTINLQYCTNTVDAFLNCSALQDITIIGLKTSISFAYSPLLTKESLLYMIDNCTSNATFTITLHNEVYAKCQEGGEWYSEVSAALNAAQSDKTTTITLASA